MSKEIKQTIASIKKQNPVILCITNYVTMDFMANSLLAISASPIMSSDSSEAEELLEIASAIVINIGTLNQHFIQEAIEFAKKAYRMGKKIILDPVGAGSTKIRTELSLQLLEYCHILKGNASEIIALSNHNIKSRGVDSVHSIEEAKQSAMELVKKYDITVVVTGESDLVINREKINIIPYGSKIMKYITGMGCALSGVIATFASVCLDNFDSANLATIYFGMCGEQAESLTSLPGSFKVHFIDALFNLKYE